MCVKKLLIHTCFFTAFSIQACAFLTLSEVLKSCSHCQGKAWGMKQCMWPKKVFLYGFGTKEKKRPEKEQAGWFVGFEVWLTAQKSIAVFLQSLLHTHTQSSKAVHTRPTAMVKFTSTFPRSSPLLVTIYPPSCPCRLFAALLFSNQHFLEAVFFPWETGSTIF